MKNRLGSVLAVATVWGFTACGGDSSSSGVDVSDDADIADVIEEPESSSGKEDKKSSSSVAKENSKKSSSSEADDKSEKENSADSKNSSSSAKNDISSSSDEEDVGSSSNTAKSSSSGKDKVESSSSAKKNDSSSSNTKDVSSSSTAQSSSSSSSETVVASSSSETPVNTSTSVQTGTYFVDERDNRSYRTVQIGNQIWMAENMKLDVSDGFCYNDTKKNCETYGVFYTAQTAVRVCPEGWKLPTKDDWNELAVYIGIENSSSGSVYTYQDENVVPKLKSESGWKNDNGTDELGFSAFPAGQFNGTKYTGFGEKAYFMGSAYSGGDGEYAYITENKIVATGKTGISSKLAMPVRCMQPLPCNSSNQGEVISKSICDGSKWRPATLDEMYGVCDDATDGNISSDGIYACSRQNWRKMGWLEKEIGVCSSKNEGVKKDGYTCTSGIWYGELVDSRDNQVYKTVVIDSLTWMAENLNYEIEDSYVTDSYSYCYKDDPSYCDKYGRLYTWGAASSACPSGWHLSTTSDFDYLIKIIGDDFVEKLKSADGWNNGMNGVDTYGFSILPGGYRSVKTNWYETDVGSVSYGSESSNACFWLKNEKKTGYAYLFRTSKRGCGSVSVDEAYFDYSSEDSRAYSARCVKKTK